jgi:hypothetical protein
MTEWPSSEKKKGSNAEKRAGEESKANRKNANSARIMQEEKQCGAKTRRTK